MKKKKLNVKREAVQERLKQNPEIEQRKFDNLLDRMIQPESGGEIAAMQ